MMSISKSKWIGAVIAVMLSPIIIPVVIATLLLWLIATAAIRISVSLLWSTRGISYLVVYSDSAQWKSYFEEEVIPSFGRRAKILNLSTAGGRKKWWHLDWWLYKHCAGYRNRFPIILRFSAFGRWKAVRFYDAYMQAKKGKTAALEHSKALVHEWSPKRA
jgi:hypothetical protein